MNKMFQQKNLEKKQQKQSILLVKSNLNQQRIRKRRQVQLVAQVEMVVLWHHRLPENSPRKTKLIYK